MPVPVVVLAHAFTASSVAHLADIHRTYVEEHYAYHQHRHMDLEAVTLSINQAKVAV